MAASPSPGAGRSAGRLIPRRLPLQSGEPVVWFAWIRLALVAAGLAAVLAFHVPHKTGSALVLGALGITWSAAVLAVARRRAPLAMNPGVAVGDLVVLGVLQVVEPEAYAGVRFVALFLIATHAYFLGELRGLAVAVAGVLALVPATPFLDMPLQDGTLTFYEALFAV